ncbi:hypothetical protein BWI17_01115 [Betaproteobacteria bacterium GR16-43]|nr:hypothetical protein BWI17_01115 [Betaproteobacteria bacterium GR16-43]
MYENGRDFDKNDAQAYYWFRRAAAQGDSEAMFSVGFYAYYGRWLRADFREAMSWFRRGAEAGHSSSQAYLGVMYSLGQGAARDDAEAVAWFERAARSGNAVALYNLAVMVERGRGIPQDAKRAATLYQQAIAGGMSMALINLGYLHEQGSGVAKNEGRAVELYARAADLHLPMGMTNLAAMYEHGSGVARNLDKAISLNTKAGAAGSSRGYWGLYRIYNSKERRDLALAEDALVKASELGDSSALVELVSMLGAERQQPRVLRSSELLVRLERAARLETSVAAMMALADYYDRGWFTPVDRLQARKWLEFAAESGSDMGRWHLGRYLVQGWGGPIDKRRAAELWRASELAGNDDAKLSLAGALVSGDGVARDVSGGERKLRELIEKGHPRAKLIYAHFVVVGMLSEPSWDVVDEIRSKADAGDGFAQCDIGFLYESGTRLPKDLKAAREWYARAANLGFEWAVFRQAVVELESGSQTIRGDVALARLQELDRAGHCGAQVYLASAYMPGGPFPTDTEMAESMLRRAKANLSCEDPPRVTLLLGAVLLLEARARPEAIRLLEDAATSGVPEASFLLGSAYEFGYKVEVNPFKAREQYKRASERGSHAAAYSLAQMMMRGVGGPVDVVGASRLLGTIPAEKLQDLAKSRAH